MPEKLQILHSTSEIQHLLEKIRNLESNMEVCRKREGQYKAILNGIEDGYYEVDLKGNTTFFNEAYLSIFGYTAREMKGKNYKEYVSEETSRTIFGIFNQVFKTGRPIKALDWPLIRKDGSLGYVQVSISLIRDFHGSPTGFRGIMRDITAMVMAKEELRRARIKAEEASVIKSEFLANMSHELRTPLNAIIGFGDILAQADLPPKQKEYAEAIRKNGNILLNLVENILDFSKNETALEDIQTFDFDPGTVIDHVLDETRDTIKGKPIELLYRRDKKLPRAVHTDPALLRQILTILLGNAAKFTDKGEIELAVDVAHEEESSLALYIRVRDTGIGMTDEQLGVVFEPFRQADGTSTRKYGGAGLGLSICSKLVARLNGNLWVESTHGSGSIFHVTLSLARTRTLTKSDKKPMTIRKRRVLLVEDNPVNQKMTSVLLTKAGYHVDLAVNGQEAVDKVVHDPAQYDLVLMDIQMPVLDGLEATEMLRQKGIDQLPIIALTANVMVHDREKCLAAGMNDYISKPVRRDKVLQVIEKWFI